MCYMWEPNLALCIFIRGQQWSYHLVLQAVPYK